MRTSRFWYNHLFCCFLSPSIFSSFTLPLFSYLAFALLSLAFLSPCFFLSAFTPLCLSLSLVAHPLYSSILLAFFSSAPYKYMGGYEAKVRNIDRKVTFFLWNLFIWKVYLAKLCGNMLQNTPTFENSISLLEISCSDLVCLFSSIFPNSR